MDALEQTSYAPSSDKQNMKKKRIKKKGDLSELNPNHKIDIKFTSQKNTPISGNRS